MARLTGPQGELMASNLRSNSCWHPSIRTWRTAFISGTSRVLALSLLAGMVGCAAAAAVHKRDPATIANGVLTPTLPPAPAYGNDPTREACPETSVVRLLTGMLASSSKNANKAAPKLDPQLCAMSSSLSGWDASAGAPPEQVTTWLVQYFGHAQVQPRVLVSKLETEEPRQVAGKVTEVITNQAFSMVAPAWGLTTWRIKKGTTGIALVILDQNVTLLQPVPKRLDLGQKTTVQAKITGGDFEQAGVVYSDVMGNLKTERKPMAEPVTMELACGDKPGKLLVQLRGYQGDMGTPLASFAVACGEPAPTSLTLPTTAPATVDVAASEKDVFEAINKARAAVGVKPVEVDPDVAAIARQRSEGLREQAKGQGSGPGDLATQLRSAGIVSPVVLQNPARARSVADAITAFSSSPVAYSQTLSKDVTHVGVGVAFLEATDSVPSSVFVTELFVAELPVVDTAEVKAKLRAAIDQRRADARSPVLKADPVLDDLGQKLANLLAASKGEPSKDDTDALLGQLQGKGYKAINLIQGARADYMDFAEDPKMVSDNKLVGLGVAQGFNSRLGKNAVYIVIFLGTSLKNK